jgi:sugar (pentulose or hexulose) kinase
LQSVSFVERWGYEVMEQCGVRVGDLVFSTGGAAESPIFAQLRSNVLNRQVVRCKHPTAAFGAAILAAAGTLYDDDISTAIRDMTAIGASYSPSSSLVRRYDEIYDRFRSACARRGYA